jgi:hypothetical protein
MKNNEELFWAVTGKNLLAPSLSSCCTRPQDRRKKEPVHPAYNPSFSACFFSRNNIFLSQQISQQCFSAGLPAQLNGAKELAMVGEVLYTLV